MVTRRRGRLALAAYAVLLSVHLGAHLAGSAWSEPTQWMLMPTLVLVLMSAQRGLNRLSWLTVAGLVFSWAGDALPFFAPQETSFLVLVGCFALAQVTYAVAFAPFRAHRWRGWWPTLILMCAVAMVAVCAPGAGPLLAPAVLYATVIATMAVLAPGIHRLTGIGAGIFMVSDSLIAMDAFVPSWNLPAQGFWVMATYGLAQLLIVLGVLARSARGAIL